MKKLFSIFLLGWSAVAYGADYYVATNGSDAAAGTLGAPFETIQHGVDLLGAGDTLHVRGGRYHENCRDDLFHAHLSDEAIYAPVGSAVSARSGFRTLRDAHTSDGRVPSPQRPVDSVAG